MKPHRPQKKFGQNFLKDENIAQKIVSFSKIQPHDSVLEIGPGKGALTKYLLEELQEKKFSLYLVEKDRDLISYLESLRGKYDFQLFNADILSFDLEREIPGSQKIKVLGNIPYNITSEILFYLVRRRSRVASAVLTIQKEVAERLAAAPRTKAYSRLSVMIQYYSSVTCLLKLDKSLFSPVPKVDSMVVAIDFEKPFEKPGGFDEKLFSNVVKSAFAFRRKKMANSLKGFLKSRRISGKLLFDWFEELGIAPNARAEELSVKDFVSLSQKIQNYQFEEGD